LQPSRQLAILDAFAGLVPRRQRFAEAVRLHQSLESQQAALGLDDQTHAQQVDLLRHQVREIEAARLATDEEASLDAAYQRARNAVRLMELAQAALRSTNEDELSLLNLAGHVGRTLADLQRLDPEAAPLSALHEQVVALLNDLQADLGHYADRLDTDPEQLQLLEERVNLLHGLKRKYGRDTAEILSFADEARRQLQRLESRESEIERLDNELANTRETLVRLGSELSSERSRVIPELCQAVTRELRELGFTQSHFDIHLKSRTLEPAGRLSPSGFDALEFLFAPNPGEPPRPLRSIASSGEMSRVMLGLKTVLVAQDDVPVLVFDEVDANIGGPTAQVVGEKMRRLGTRHQVLCITHLAPVAACAAAHFRVAKVQRANRTFTEIEPLPPNLRVKELARMLGGIEPAAQRHAKALLKARPATVQD
jgi:DNA repair protein RecN (Recombination protein N)